MNRLTSLITATLMAGWMSTIAVFSIQNITAVSLKLGTFESIQLPVGVLLSLCVSGGIIVGAVIPPLWANSKKSNRSRFNQQNSDDFDFEFDD